MFTLFSGAGMTVVGTAGTPQGMELVKNNGAHLVFNHRYILHSPSRRLIYSPPVRRHIHSTVSGMWPGSTRPHTNSSSFVYSQGKGILGPSCGSGGRWRFWRHYRKRIRQQSRFGLDRHRSRRSCCGTFLSKPEIFLGHCLFIIFFPSFFFQ